MIYRKFSQDPSERVKFLTSHNLITTYTRGKGTEAIVVFSSDSEKQEQVIALTKQHQGVLYACVGIHCDNIKRTNNEKQIQQRLELLRKLGTEKETYVCVLASHAFNHALSFFSSERIFKRTLTNSFLFPFATLF